MASYHCSIKAPLSRAKGQHLIGKAAYNARTQYLNERTGETTPDYSSRGGLLKSFVMVDAKANAPQWMKDDPHRLLNAAVLAETYKNAREGQEIIFGFPHELGIQKNEWMLNDFLREQFTRREIGRVAIVNIHEPGVGDQRNVHAHVLLLQREAGPEGFGEKLPELEPEDYQRIRQKWAEYGAKEMRKDAKKIRAAGDEDRAAALGLEADRYAEGWRDLEQQRQAALERGDLAHAETLNRPASKHRGPAVDAQERKGQETDRGNIYRDTEQGSETVSDLKIQLAEIQKAIADYERDWTNIFDGIGTPVTPEEAQRDLAQARRDNEEEARRAAQEIERQENPFADLGTPVTQAEFGKLREQVHRDNEEEAQEAAYEAQREPGHSFAEFVAQQLKEEPAPAAPARQQDEGQQEKEVWRVSDEQEQPEQARQPEPDLTAKPISATRDHIRNAVRDSDSPKALAAALREKGIRFAMTTEKEAERSRADAAAARERGEYAPIYRPGEIVAINHVGYVYRLTEQTTGTGFDTMQRYLRKLDPSEKKGIDQTRREIKLEQAMRSLEIADSKLAGLKSSTMTALNVAGKSLMRFGKMFDTAADIASDLLSPRVPLTKEQTGTLRDEKERHAETAEREAAREIHWHDYTDEFERISAKRDAEAREAQQRDQQHQRLQRDRGEGRERER